METKDTKAKATSNWQLAGGSNLSQVIQTKIVHDDLFIRPELDEILSEDRAILLSAQSDIACALPQDPCEFTIQIPSTYKIESLTLVSTVPKIELFIESRKEYLETLYGATIDEGDDDEDSVRSYRFDVEILKSGISEITLKLLTISIEVCIYAIQLNIAPNPNGITTLLPNTINLDNVEEILNNSNQKLSPNAEKCKMFLQMYKSKSAQSCQLSKPATTATTTTNDTLAFDHMKKVMGEMLSVESKENQQNNSCKSTNGGEQLKQYFDMRIEELEVKMLSLFEAFEHKQISKLDRILHLLEAKGKNNE